VSARPEEKPAPLVVAASLVAVEGLLMLLYAVLEAANLSTERLSMGVTTSVFFAAYGAGLVLLAWQVTRGQGWARSPLLLAQLIQIGLAWSFWGGATTWVAVGLALVAVIVIAGLLHPASMEALRDAPSS
jgi:hypothetical protein